jgi:hypothetical protein
MQAVQKEIMPTAERLWRKRAENREEAKKFKRLFDFFSRYSLLKGLHHDFWTQNSFHFQCSKLIMYPILIWKAKFELSDDKDKKDIQPPQSVLCKHRLVSFYVNKHWWTVNFAV